MMLPRPRQGTNGAGGGRDSSGFFAPLARAGKRQEIEKVQLYIAASRRCPKAAHGALCFG